MSLPEVPLRQRVGRSPEGVTFRRQHPIGSCRADLCCATRRLVVEVDGMAHDAGDRPARDADRTTRRHAPGYTMFRVAAADVLRDADAVAASVVALALRPLHHACGMVPLPARGEDREIP